MPSIRINRFGGMKPKFKRGLAQTSTLASLAVDVDVETGALRPWRYPSLEVQRDSDPVCTIHKEECCWLTSENPCASFTRGDTDCNRIFSTGVMPWPAYAVLPKGSQCCEEECEVEWCRLGVPAPESAPTIVDSTPLRDPKECFDGSNTYESDYSTQLYREPRSYFITFVNEFGEEGSPSDPSDIIDVDVDGEVTLGFNIPPIGNGYCDPVSIRIYRGLPSNMLPDEIGGVRSQILSNNEIGDFDSMVASAYFFVEEIPYQEGNFTFTDTVPADCLGEANTTSSHMPPLECLENIQVIENGSLVASYGKELWFSEPWKFHSWNCAMNLDDCIINFKVARSAIYVATDGYPYVIGSMPNENEDCLCCRNVNKLLEPAPIVSGCSMVLTNSGVMWATNSGLVRLAGNQMTLVTHDTLTEDQWQAYLPHQLKGAFYKGRYFGFNRDKGFIFDVQDGIYSESYPGENGKFTELSLTPDAVHKTENNELFMSFGGDIYKWNASDTYMPYTWRSMLHVESGVRNFSIMKVVFEDWLRGRKAPNEAVIRLYSDDKLFFTRNVDCSRPFRLPKGIDGLNFMIEITSTEQVAEIHMATSKMELTNVNNS